MTDRQAGSGAIVTTIRTPNALLPDWTLSTNFPEPIDAVKRRFLVHSEGGPDFLNRLALDTRRRTCSFPFPLLPTVDMARFFAGMICGAMLLFVTMHYHIVRGNSGVVLVPKITNNFSDVYTDIRSFDLQDWKQHKPLAAAIMRSNQADLLKNSAHRSFGDSIGKLVDGLFSKE